MTIQQLQQLLLQTREKQDKVSLNHEQTYAKYITYLYLCTERKLITIYHC